MLPEEFPLEDEKQDLPDSEQNNATALNETYRFDCLIHKRRSSMVRKRSEPLLSSLTIENLVVDEMEDMPEGANSREVRVSEFQAKRRKATESPSAQ